MLGSQFQIEVTARPGHTAEELEKAIDEELAALRATPPDAARDRAGAQHDRDADHRRSRAPGGFGGVANRLNSYNHYLDTPDYLQKDIQRYRAVTPAIDAERSRAISCSRRRASSSMRCPANPTSIPGPPASPAPKAAAAQGAESINADEPWRNEMPHRRTGQAAAAADAADGALCERLTLILSERRDCRSSPRISCSRPAATRTRSTSRASPISSRRCSTKARRRGTRCRSPTRSRSSAASLTPAARWMRRPSSAGSLRKNFPALLDLLADVALHPSFPPDGDRAAACEPARPARAAAREPVAARGAGDRAALYGSQHPYGFTEIGTEAS